MKTELTRHASGREIESFEAAEELAALMTEDRGTLWLATDSGRGVWPRYRVMEAPKVGDAVSMGFNGDYYPEGEIASISKTYYAITTTTGKTFRRVKKTGSWKLPNGNPFCLVPGHRREWNREF